MIEEALLQYGQTGFAMGVAAFVLIRVEKSIKENTKMIHGLIEYLKEEAEACRMERLKLKRARK